MHINSMRGSTSTRAVATVVRAAVALVGLRTAWVGTFPTCDHAVDHSVSTPLTAATADRQRHPFLFIILAR
jgi:hypothetical protein